MRVEAPEVTVDAYVFDGRFSLPPAEGLQEVLAARHGIEVRLYDFSFTQWLAETKVAGWMSASIPQFQTSVAHGDTLVVISDQGVAVAVYTKETR